MKKIIGKVKLQKNCFKIIAIMCILLICNSTVLPLFSMADKEGNVFAGTKYAFTDDQIARIASMCYAENGSSENSMRAEATVMANLYESVETGAKTTNGFITYITTSPNQRGEYGYGWFSTYDVYDNNPTDVGSNYLAAVKDVLVNGNRYFPYFVNEHDCLSDIAYITNEGVQYDKNDKTKYIKGKTVIHQVSSMGGQWVFYEFPNDSNCDPFGYTDSSLNLEEAIAQAATGTVSNAGTPVDINRVLFVGDSVTVGLATMCGLTHFAATVGDSPEACYNSINTDNRTYTGTTNHEMSSPTETYNLPQADEIDAIALMIGVNNPYQTNYLSMIVEKIHTLYPNKTVYVESILTVSKNSEYPEITPTVVNTYNETIQGICAGLTNVRYIDVSANLYDEDGYMKSEYVQSDGAHPNQAGNDILLENIKNAIGNIGTTTSTGTTYVSPYQLTISVNEDTRTFKISYSKYDEERYNKLKEQFTEMGMEDTYQKLVDEDKEKGIDETDDTSSLAIIASFIDNGFYLSEDVKDYIEYIPKFFKAELTSTYPDIRKSDKLGDKIEWEDMALSEFQGIVKFNRRSVEQDANGSIQVDGNNEPIQQGDEGNGQLLEYISKEEFDQMKTDQNLDIENYFTMDEKCTYVIIPNVNSNNGNISITEQKINYQPVVRNFAMKFELLFSFLIVGQSKPLSDKMIDLAYNDNTTNYYDLSANNGNYTIVIDLMENINITDNWNKTTQYTDTQDITFEIHYINIGSLTFPLPLPVIPPSSEENFVISNEEETVSRTINKTYTVKVGKVNTWICEMEQNFKPVYTENIGTYGEETYSEITRTIIDAPPTVVYRREGHQTKIDIYKVNWEEDGEKVTHIKIKDDQGNYEGLLKLLSKKTANNLFTLLNLLFSVFFPNYQKEYKYRDTISNLFTGDKVIFKMLEDAGETTTQVNLIKYMFYIFFNDYYYGESETKLIDYGVTEAPTFDELFKSTSNFNLQNVGTLAGNNLEEKVWIALKNIGLSDYAVAGVMGNIYAESTFVADAVESNGEGYGLCQWSYGRKTQLLNYAASKGVSWTDEDTQIEFLIAEITGEGNAVGFSDYQMYNETYENNWLNATNATDAAIAFCYGFERPGIVREGVRTEWAEKYYDRYAGLDLSSYNSVYTGDIFTDSSGKTFNLYKQNGDEYKNVSYPARNGTIGANGCGPTSCAIIGSGYGCTDTPATLVADGSNYSGYDGIIRYFQSRGFEVDYQYTMSDSAIKQKLQDGYEIVVLSEQGYVGCYSLGSYSHWYTLLDVNGDKVFVGDPLTAGGGWFSLDDLIIRNNYICVKK